MTEKTTIPVLWNHNPEALVGRLVGNVATFLPGKVTHDNMLPAGWRVIRWAEGEDGKRYILEAEILELSVYPVGVPL